MWQRISYTHEEYIHTHTKNTCKQDTYNFSKEFHTHMNNTFIDIQRIQVNKTHTNVAKTHMNNTFIDIQRIQVNKTHTNVAKNRFIQT